MAATISADVVDGNIVVTVDGEVDMDSADKLQAVLRRAAADRPTQLRVDIRAVPVLDSTGLSALIAGYRAAIADHVELVLVNPNPFILRVLEVTGLSPLLRTEVSLPHDDQHVQP